MFFLHATPAQGSRQAGSGVRRKAVGSVLAVLLVAQGGVLRAGFTQPAIFGDGFEALPDCEDPGEPGSEAQALDLGAVDDCDNAVLTAGVLDGAADIDFFRVDVTDSFLCSFDAALSVQAAAPLRACLFFECFAGTATVSCPGGSAATSPLGRPGCCVTGSSTQLEPDVGCAGTPDDDLRAFVRLDQAAEPCVGYAVDLRF